MADSFAKATIQLSVEIEIPCTWSAGHTIRQVTDEATAEAVAHVNGTFEHCKMKIVGQPRLTVLIFTLFVALCFACSSEDFRSRSAGSAGSSGPSIGDGAAAGASPEYSGGAGASHGSSSDGGEAGSLSPNPGGDGGIAGVPFTGGAGSFTGGGGSFSWGASSGAGGDAGVAGIPEGTGGLVGGAGAGASPPTSGAGGSLPPTGPCAGLCSPEGALDVGALSFDGLGRGYLYPPGYASCLEVTESELGYAIHNWSCQAFPADRSVSVNGTAYPGCSGSPLYQLPPSPPARDGGWCFQTTAGSGTPVLAFF